MYNIDMSEYEASERERERQFHGELTEHNDGLIRGPFLTKMYNQQIIGIFKQVKNIFDPQNIFNPHKKTVADWEYSKTHIRQHFN